MRIYLHHIVTILFCLNAFSQAPNIEWQKSLGGSNEDALTSIKRTVDGGYIVAGTSKSTNGDVANNQGDYDYWVAKLNDNGTIVWKRSLGGLSPEYAHCVIQTSDGGYVVSGHSYSNNGHVTNNKGFTDYWIVKLDAFGVLIWQKTLGGNNYDYGKEIQETTDGGLIVCGFSGSSDGDATSNHGNYDFWIVKMNAFGGIMWQKSLGGSDTDNAYSIKQTTDGGYIIAGGTLSNNGDVTLNHGGHDVWIVKLDASGNLSWQKCYGGSSLDYAYSILQTADGGYIFVGYSMSVSGDVTDNHGGMDYWVVKIDSTGTLVWQKSLGGSLDEVAMNIIQTLDGNYIVSGMSESNNGNLTNNNGQLDFWIIKINDFGNIIWQKSIGGSGSDDGWCTVQASDSGFVIVGSSDSNDIDISGNHGSSDFCIVKLFPENLANSEFELVNTCIYPNPSSNFINITNGTIEENFNFKIVDTTGKMVQNGFSKFNAQINIGNLESGNYFIIIKTEKGLSSTEKFIKN